MKVKVNEIQNNPYRNMDRYPVDLAKIERLKNSIEQTGFWDNILARKKDGQIQLAYGHHRLIAIKELGIEEIDIPVKNISDADMVRIMALENREQEDMSQAIMIETVRVVRDFLDAELTEYDNWDRVNDFIKSLFESPESFTKTKQTGVGQTTILKFLGEGWKQWKIQSALDTLSSDDINQDAITLLKSTGQAEGFKKALREVNKGRGEFITPEQQIQLAKKLTENDPVTGKTGGGDYYKSLESFIRQEIDGVDEFQIALESVTNKLNSIQDETRKLSTRVAELNGILDKMRISEIKSFASIISINEFTDLLNNIGVLAEYLGITINKN